MTTAPPPSLPASLGGYRLVRTLGTGPRATVHLGHADGHPQAAVKVFAAAVPAERIEREAEALMRAAGEHVVRLADLALDERGRPAFLLDRIAGPSLGALVDRRRVLEPGEAVTILAPVAAALARMHRDGVVHGGLDPASVLFTDAGSPTLIGFGDAELFDPTATGRARVAARSALVERDEAALRRLAGLVLDATSAETSAEAAAIRALQALPGDAGYAERLADAVFELAEPQPVDLDAPARMASGMPGRLLERSAEPDRPSGSSPLVLDALQLPGWLQTALRGSAGIAVARLRAIGGSVRRPFWVAGGVAAAALLVSIVLTPTGASDPAATPGPTGTAEPTARGAPAAAGSPASGSAAEGVLLEDDPAAAARELLDRRADCFRELSVLCLDGVDGADSSAAVADAAEILAAQERGGVPAEGVVLDGPVETVERLGDTALVRVILPDAEPASVLVLRTEAGWRIRGFPGAAHGAADPG
jgi:predicted Ser/Thr protein kinase